MRTIRRRRPIAQLAEIDGVQDRKGVVLGVACHDPRRLDPALVHSGRLGREDAVEAREMLRGLVETVTLYPEGGQLQQTAG